MPKATDKSIPLELDRKMARNLKMNHATGLSESSMTEGGSICPVDRNSEPKMAEDGAACREVVL